MAKISFVFSAISLLVFVLVFSEIGRVNGQYCERESQTYERLLCRNRRCDRKCIRWEKAVHGACHLRNWKRSCYCYYDTNCDKVPPPSVPPPGSSAGGSGGSGGGIGGGAGGKGGKDDKCIKEAK